MLNRFQKSFFLSTLGVMSLASSCEKNETKLINDKQDTNTTNENILLKNDNFIFSKEKTIELIDLDEKKLSDEILKHINLHRNSIGKIELLTNETAKMHAIYHSNEQAKNNHMSHNNSANRLAAIFFTENASTFGENVGFGYFDTKRLVQAWLNSKEHKANIEGDFTHTGIGTVANDKGVLYFTQIFFK